MADTKITALTAITTVDPAADVLPIVDVSDTSMAASGTTKKITSNQILGAGGTATLASATITGDLTVDSGTLRVNSSNDRVGVGTNSPTSKLHVFGAGTNTSLTISDVGANYNIVLGTQSADIAQLAVFNTTIASGSKDFWLTASSHTFNTWTGSAYSSRFVIASDGVCTWSNVGGVAGTAMTLNATGLGVGASPAEKLTVAGKIRSVSSTFGLSDVIAETTAGTGTGYARLIVKTADREWRLINDASTSGSPFIIYDATAAANRLLIDSSGNVGIGVTPSAWFSSRRAVSLGGGSSLSGYIGSPGTELWTNTYLNAAGNAIYVYSNYEASRFYSAGGAFVWENAPNSGAGGAGTTATLTPRMTLDASGTLLVGTTSSLQNTSHSFKALGTSNSFWASTFQHDGTTGSPRLLGWRLPNSSDSNAYFVYAINSGGNCFNVFGNGSVTNSTGTYGTISDLRLKENISDARNYLADLLKLRVVKYSLKSEQSSEATKLGFIAQEVEQVFPTLVETNGDDVKSIKTTVLIPMLLKALQELTARVQTLETR